MTAPNILTGLNVNVHTNLCLTPDGVLLITNGVDTPKRWDGKTASAETAGIAAPSVAPTLTDDTGGGSVTASSTYYGAYRYIDDDLEFLEDGETAGPQPSSISPLGSVTTSSAGSHRIDWSGLAASSDSRAIKVQLWRSTAGQSTTLYGPIVTLNTGGSITSSANNAGTVRFTVPTGHGLVAGAVVTVSGHSTAGYNTSHTVTAVTATTVDTSVAYSAIGTGGTWTLTGYIDEGTTDTALQALTALPILNPDGTLNARRFTPPPNFKAVSVPFQGRHWYGVNIEYTSGSVQVSNGSATVTGTNTAWTSAMAGRYFTKVGDTRSYLISSASATSITLSENYAGTGTSGSSYGIRVAGTEKGTWMYSEVEEPESVPTQNTVRIDMSGGTADDDTGAMEYNSYLYLLQKRHVYRMGYNEQGYIKAQISKVATRGCFNQRCWAVHEGIAYLMDAAGPYRFNGSQPDPFGQAIQNYWRDATIDLTYAETFFVSVDPVQEVVKFRVFIRDTGDADIDYPTQDICYGIRTNSWWVEKWAYGAGGSCLFELDGRLRTALGTINDTVLLANQGTTEIVTSVVTGTATSSGISTLTDSAANFATSIVGAPVYIDGGTGKGQAPRYITTRNSSTQFTVNESWDVSLDTTSTYVIGGVPYRGKTGLLRYVQVDRDNPRSASVVFEPTAAAASLDMRCYTDHNTTPENFAYSTDPGDGVATTDGKPDAVVNLYVDKSTLQKSSGHGRLPLSGFGDFDHQCDRWFALEIRGVQKNDAIKLYGLTIEGVQ